MDIMVLKVKSIIITLLFLFVAHTPAHATIYFYFDAEDGTVGNPVPNPPICTEQCGTYGVQPTYQSSGGAPQGSMYFEWQTYDNQPSNYTEIHNTQGLPITNIIGKTYYLAYFFNFTRINGLDIWHETGQSGDKGVELVGSGLRWGIGGGHWPSHADNQDHRYTMMIGNATYHLNPELEVADGYVQNQSGYNANNPLQLQYEQWYSAVFAIKMTTDNTGSVTLYIDGMKLYEYNNIKTVATNSATITDIREGGTIAQPAYDAPAHYRKFDALMLTDNWQDIVDRGYLSSDTPPPSDGGNTPPPSSSSTGGDSSASGGSGCGFVKDDNSNRASKSQSGRVTDIGLMILLVLALTAIVLFRKVKYFKGLLFLTIFLFPFSIANAADYYVATNGNDANPGTLAAPWRHVAFATCGGSYLCPITVNNPNKLKPGDTLYLRAGTYNESNIRFGNSGAPDAPITVASYPGETAEIDGGYTATSQLTGKGHIFFVDGPTAANSPVNHVIIERLTLRNARNAMVMLGENYGPTNIIIRDNTFIDLVSNDNSGCVFVNGANHVQVVNNTMHGWSCVAGSSCTSAAGVHIFNGKTLTIRNNHFYDLRAGMYWKSGYDNNEFTIFENNLVHDAHQGAMSNHRGTIIRNNVMYNLTSRGVEVFEESASCDRLVTPDNRITHNTIVTASTGIFLTRSHACPGAVNTLVQDNIVADFLNNEHRGLSVYPYYGPPYGTGTDTSNTTFDHNLIYAAAYPSPIRILSNYYSVANALLAGSGNIQQAPVFVNAANGDYTLTTASPGKNAASDGYDMGADTSLPPTPTPDGGGSDTGGNGGNNSGGGDTSSGGSGCGFVKDDNVKGPRAKGEGLAFAVMLIIALSGIALRKIIVDVKMRRTFSALNKGLRFFVVAVLLAQIAACGSGGGGGGGGSGSGSSDSSNTSPSGGSGGGGGGAFEGFGSNVTGGTGGTIVTVTNLNNSGSGSLREAVNGTNRIVQFALYGTINLASPINVNGPNVTIDGFSAPSPGITITSSSDAFVISGNSSWPDTKGSNIIVQGLRIRNAAGDGVQIAYNAHDIVVDHNSFAGSGDGEVDITEGAYNVTISNNILAKNNGSGASLLATDASRVSYHHNIYYSNHARNPKMDASYTRFYSSGPQHAGTLADVRYNIIWNYEIGTYMFSEAAVKSQVNVVSNLYKSSGTSNPSNVIVRDSYAPAPQGDAYVQGNITIQDCRGNAYSENWGSFPYLSTNSMNNHAEFSAPAITGPSVSDRQGRLNEWLAVKNGAGVISKYADDANDLEVRTAIVVPSISIFSAAWND